MRRFSDETECWQEFDALAETADLADLPEEWRIHKLLSAIIYWENAIAAKIDKQIAEDCKRRDRVEVAEMRRRDAIVNAKQMLGLGGDT